MANHGRSALRQKAYASGDDTELAAASMMNTLIAELRILGLGKRTPDYRRGYIAGWTASKKGSTPTFDLADAAPQRQKEGER